MTGDERADAGEACLAMLVAILCLAAAIAAIIRRDSLDVAVFTVWCLGCSAHGLRIAVRHLR